MFNGEAINLPKPITTMFQEKLKVRHMMESQPLLFLLNVKEKILLVYISIKRFSGRKCLKMKRNY